MLPSMFSHDFPGVFLGYLSFFPPFFQNTLRFSLMVPQPAPHPACLSHPTTLQGRSAHPCLHELQTGQPNGLASGPAQM